MSRILRSVFTLLLLATATLASCAVTPGGGPTVVLSSGYDERDTLAAWRGSPLVSFLKKPYDIGDLILRIQSGILEARRESPKA